MSLQQTVPANAQTYTTEREIIDQARQRIRESGTEHADPNDMTLVVLGYIGDMVRQSVARAQEQSPRSVLATVLRDGGPWAMAGLVLLMVAAERLGVDLGGVLGGG